MYTYQKVPNLKNIAILLELRVGPFVREHVGHDVVGHGEEGSSSEVQGFRPAGGIRPQGAHHRLHLSGAVRFEVSILELLAG